ncbi:S-adenosylhomocysteine hydrolase [Thiohalobacter thiocyanaticus]|uniref:Adenosylhomocysteinase n=1 Tax=Thiohalobacter thiocyanaticus TaxID=585455 RepID=A0A1Z4VQU8_9GAMM|nr:adenosylhomocysteinase [Thiohalobacter thiocyanaticus]BAZ94011.1 S-adenosylhomocysteine hydrolase [Thiohalobacter thiocyanaticus]
MADIKNPDLAAGGRERIAWAAREMPVLRQLSERLGRERPLAGLHISGCLHITTETANLALALQAAGAEVVLCASNPLSTQDDVAAALAGDHGIPVFAIRGESTETYYGHINAALDHRPVITLDDGADLVSEIHKRRRDLIDSMLGGTEETTTGVIRLRAMAAEGALSYPVIAVNDAQTKHLFDNRYGTGQSTLDGLIRATNILLAGKTFVVCGYGWCGRGIAMRAKGHGAHVIVTEVEPLRALEAAMDGFRVLPLREAAAIADFIVTATGDKHVVDRTHFERMKDGCVLANSGHFNVEINIPALEALAVERRRPRASVEEFLLADGRRLCLLAEGRLVNLAAAEGHPSAVMDMSFANQLLAVVHLAQHGRELAAQVHPVPAEIDREVARLKLAAMGIDIDNLTGEQRDYLSSWQEGT